MIRPMCRNRRRSLSIAGAFAAAVAGGAGGAEIVVQNDTLCNGCTGAIQAGFIGGESAAVWLTSPCNGTIVAVQILWQSVSGGMPQTLEEVIWIRTAGNFPSPGVVLEELLGPVMTDGFLNEFRYLDKKNTVPLAVPVTAGQTFAVQFTFFNDPNPHNGPSVVTDTNGCQNGRNAIFANPGGWLNSCALGLSGDFVIRAVIDCPGAEPTGGCCLPSGTCLGDQTADECAAAGGTYQGDGALCPPSCPQPPGACCFSDPDGCANLTQAQCATARGTWEGANTSCATTVCNPVGACCLTDGTCVNGVAEDDCVGASGVFQGHATVCGPETCPAPLGGCCLSNGSCLNDLDEETCASIPNATWGGPGTDCADGDDNGTADVCELDTCPADIDDSGTVGITDLLLLLAVWGPCPGCLADINDDGVVGITDLLALLAAWGPC